MEIGVRERTSDYDIGAILDVGVKTELGKVLHRYHRPKIRNAIIRSIGIFTNYLNDINAMVDLDYGGSGQGFSGVLFTYHEQHKFDCTGLFLHRVMAVAGVSSVKELANKSVRAIIHDGLVVAIAHITDDKIVFDKEHEIQKFLGELTAEDAKGGEEQNHEALP